MSKNKKITNIKIKNSFFWGKITILHDTLTYLKFIRAKKYTIKKHTLELHVTNTNL